MALFKTQDIDITGVADRFWSKVNRSLGPTACWIWCRRVDDNGYGHFSIQGKNRLAHRVAFALTFPEISMDDLDLDHRCLNHTCVNPAHLRPSTRKQNAENRPGSYCTSKTGIRGVSPNGAGWQARVRHNGKQFYLGTFRSIEEATAVVVAKRLELFSHNELDRCAS
jgi:hypothetical protein